MRHCRGARVRLNWLSFIRMGVCKHTCCILWDALYLIIRVPLPLVSCTCCCSGIWGCEANIHGDRIGDACFAKTKHLCGYALMQVNAFQNRNPECSSSLASSPAIHAGLPPPTQIPVPIHHSTHNAQFHTQCTIPHTNPFSSLPEPSTLTNSTQILHHLHSPKPQPRTASPQAPIKDKFF